VTDEKGLVWSCLVAEWSVVYGLVVEEYVLKKGMDKEVLVGLPR
jgi:hypothetical protein